MRTLFLFGVIAYSVVSLLISHWPAMVATTGPAALTFLVLMVIDLIFAATAGIKLLGPAVFDRLGEQGDEVTVTSDDVNVPDQWFYGLFGLDLLANLAANGYTAVFTTGAASFGASVWFMIEVVGLFLTFVFFKHAQRAANRKLAQGNLRRVA